MPSALPQTTSHHPANGYSRCLLALLARRQLFFFVVQIFVVRRLRHLWTEKERWRSSTHGWSRDVRPNSACTYESEPQSAIVQGVRPPGEEGGWHGEARPSQLHYVSMRYHPKCTCGARCMATLRPRRSGLPHPMQLPRSHRPRSQSPDIVFLICRIVAFGFVATLVVPGIQASSATVTVTVAPSPCSPAVPPPPMSPPPENTLPGLLVLRGY